MKRSGGLTEGLDLQMGFGYLDVPDGWRPLGGGSDGGAGPGEGLLGLVDGAYHFAQGRLFGQHRLIRGSRMGA